MNQKKIDWDSVFQEYKNSGLSRAAFCKQRLALKNFKKKHLGSIFNGQQQALKLDSVLKTINLQGSSNPIRC